MHPVQLDHLSKFDKLNYFNESRKILHFKVCLDSTCIFWVAILNNHYLSLRI